MSISHDGVGGVYTDDTFKVLERVKYTVHRSLLNNLPFCRSDAQSGKKGTQHRTNENSVATIRLERESRLHSHINERIKWAYYLWWEQIKYCHWATSQNEIWGERAGISSGCHELTPIDKWTHQMSSLFMLGKNKVLSLSDVTKWNLGRESFIGEENGNVSFYFVTPSIIPSFLPTVAGRARASGSGRPIVQTPAKREAGSRDAGAVKDSFGHSLEVKGQAREGQTRASPTCWDKWRNTGISRAWRMTSLRSCKDHAIRLVGKLPLWVGTKQKYVCTTTVCLHDIMIQTQSVWSGENEVWQFSDSEPHARELHEMHSLRDCGLSLKINRSCGNLRDRALH